MIFEPSGWAAEPSIHVGAYELPIPGITLTVLDDEGDAIQIVFSPQDAQAVAAGLARAARTAGAGFPNPKLN